MFALHCILNINALIQPLLVNIVLMSVFCVVLYIKDSGLCESAPLLRILRRHINKIHQSKLENSGEI